MSGKAKSWLRRTALDVGPLHLIGLENWDSVIGEQEKKIKAQIQSVSTSRWFNQRGTEATHEESAGRRPHRAANVSYSLDRDVLGVPPC